MDDFVKLPLEERRIYFEGTAAPRNMQAQIVEKDFWVCWTLKEIDRWVEGDRRSRVFRCTVSVGGGGEGISGLNGVAPHLGVEAAEVIGRRKNKMENGTLAFRGGSGEN